MWDLFTVFFCIFLFCCVLDFHKSFFYRKGIDTPVPRFDKNFEEFFSLCDQMELHLVSWCFSSVFLKYRVLYTQIYVARSIINSVKMPPSCILLFNWGHDNDMNDKALTKKNTVTTQFKWVKTRTRRSRTCHPSNTTTTLGPGHTATSCTCHRIPNLHMDSLK